MVASDHDPVSATAIGTFARAVETSGFSRLYLTDHIFHATPTFHSTSAFAVAAAATRNIPLGFCAYIVPFRHPIVAAKELAFLDGLCEGRLLAGLATGSSRAEMDALGVDFVSRGRRLDEALKAMLALWQNDEVSFEGEFGAPKDRATLTNRWLLGPFATTWAVNMVR